MAQTGRNRPCPCGSGRKWKLCCGRDTAARAPMPAYVPGAERTAAWWRAVKAAREPERPPSRGEEDPRLWLALLGGRRHAGRSAALPSDADFDALIEALEAPPAAGQVTIERWGGEALLVFDIAFELNGEIKAIPGRAFDWRERVWTVPLEPAAAPAVHEFLAGHPDVLRDEAVERWVGMFRGAWRATASVLAHDGEPVLVVRADVGTLPGELAEAALPGALPSEARLELGPQSAALLAALQEVTLDDPARRAIAALQAGARPVGGTLALHVSEEGEREFRLESDWDLAARRAFAELPECSACAERPGHVLFRFQRETLGVPADAAFSGELRRWLAAHPDAHATPDAERHLTALEEQWARAQETVALSHAREADLDLPALGGELRPFQRAGVAYVLRQRRTFLADEQGLGKTVQALAALEAQRAFPALVVCPASMKLMWAREVERWLPERSVAVVQGRGERGWRDGGAAQADIVLVNYDIVAAHAERLCARGLRAAVFDESHLCKDARRKRTQAAIAVAQSVAPDGLRLALTGTPILNRAPELVSQLRLIDRLSDFGSGAALGRRFADPASIERLHRNLRAHCYVRRTKAEVLPQLPPKRRITVPLELTNRAEYELAERDLVAWLRQQPLDLRTLQARVAAALRAEQLVRLNELRRLAARGKLAAALGWIEDFLAAGEPLVAFAHHRDVQHAVLARFPEAVHILGEDDGRARAAAIDAFQDPDGPRLIVCSMQAAAQGITLTRASNVAFLELDWTPARHDQAEDRCHRIGQRDAVSAYSLLAPATVDETMAEVIERKRGIVDAVTDGRSLPEEAVLAAVVRTLRETRPRGWLRAVA